MIIGGFKHEFTHFIAILGAPNYGFVSFLHHNRGSRLNFPKTVWSLEKCSMRVENSLQALRPASEAFAQEATEALKAGKVIAVPTDTLYGLACDAWYAFLLMGCFCNFLFYFVSFFSFCQL